jgi:hypothetical protein
MVTICATRHIPNNDPKFHQPLIVHGVGTSIRESFAISNRGCLFRAGLFIILCVVVFHPGLARKLSTDLYDIYHC